MDVVYLLYIYKNVIVSYGQFIQYCDLIPPQVFLPKQYIVLFLYNFSPRTSLTW